MKYLILLLAVISIVPESLQTGSCPELKEPNKSDTGISSSRAKYFCKFFEDQINEKEEKRDEINSKCQSVVLSYFKEVEESNNSIENFAKVCINNEASSLQCAEGIVHLKSLCYNMETAAELLKLAGKSQRLDKFGYTYIKLSNNDWNKLKKLEKLDVPHCLVYLSTDDYQHGMKILDEYKNWLGNNPASECSCIEVLGLEKIYSSRKSSGITLQKYYKDICLAKNKKRHVWTQYQFDAIAKDSKNTEFEAIKTFLTQATLIAEVNWFNNKLSCTYWPFSYISQQINLKSDSVSEQRIRLVAKAIRAQFFDTEFSKFVSTTSRIDLDSDCRLSILDIFFNTEKYNAVGSQNYDFIRNDNFYGRNRKSYFQLHLSSLVDLYAQSNYMGKGCERFLEILKQYKEIIFDSIWRVDHISRLLTTSVSTNKGIDLTITCLSFCKKVENSFSDFKMLASIKPTNREGYRLSDDFAIVFQEFRENLFKKPNQELETICKDEDSVRNTKSKEGIMKLVNYAFDGDQKNTILVTTFTKGIERHLQKSNS